MSNNPRAVVTGAFGFVGRNVARALFRRGFDVVGMGHGDWSRDEWSKFGLVEWHMTDINFQSLVTFGGNPELVCHCAGSGSVAYSVSNPYQDYERTVATTICVLEFIRLQAPRAKFILPSSAAVYGAATHLPISVTAPLRPVSSYGVHKKVAEDLCRSYARNFGVSVALIRLFSLYGIGLRKQLIWDACSRLARGQNEFFGTGSETRDWLHIDDAAELIIAGYAVASPECPTANGGSGVNVEIQHVIQQIAHFLKCQTGIRFNGIMRPGDPIHYQADISEAKSWGWSAKRLLAEELQSYVEWFERNKMNVPN